MKCRQNKGSRSAQRLVIPSDVALCCCVCAGARVGRGSCAFLGRKREKSAKTETAQVLAPRLHGSRGRMRGLHRRVGRYGKPRSVSRREPTCGNKSMPTALPPKKAQGCTAGARSPCAQRGARVVARPHALQALWRFSTGGGGEPPPGQITCRQVTCHSVTR